MTIIESLREYFLKCPLLSKSADINVDFLDSEENSYMIESVPTDPLIKRYINGDSIKQYVFSFLSREDYGIDSAENIENSIFYEQLSEWIEDNNKKEILPQLSEGKESMEMKILTSGYAFQTEMDNARYVIQLKLIYFEKGVI